MSEQKTLYERVGGYEAIYKFAEDVIARLMDDEEVGHIWDHMSQDRVVEEHQNFVDGCANTGGSNDVPWPRPGNSAWGDGHHRKTLAGIIREN